MTMSRDRRVLQMSLRYTTHFLFCVEFSFLCTVALQAHRLLVSSIHHSLTFSLTLFYVQDGHQDDDDDEDEEQDDSSYERAEAKEVDDLIRKYSTYTSNTTTKSSATSSHDAKQPSPDRYTHQEARSKAASSSSSAYDYKRQEAGEGKYRDESDEEEQDEEEEEEEEDVSLTFDRFLCGDS